MFERFTDRARQVVVLAQLEARRLNHGYIGTEHLLLGLIGDGQGAAAHVLADAGVTHDAVRAGILEAVGSGRQQPSGHMPFTPRSKKILELALREALDQGSEHIGTEHLLLGLIREGEGVGAQLLDRLGGGLDAVRDAVLSFAAQGSSEPAKRRTASSGPARRSESTWAPVTGEYVLGAPRPPKRLRDPLVERPEPTRRLLTALGRREQNNALVVGPAGCGKTALVYGAAQWLSGDRGPASLHGMELVELDGLDRLMLRGGAARLVRHTLAAVILIEDLGTLLAVDERAGGRVVLGLSALADAASPLALTADDAAYERFTQAYPSLARRFAEIRLEETDPAFTRRVLEKRRRPLAAFHKVEIEDSALDAAIESGPIAMPGRALPDRVMPGRALDLLDAAAAHASASSLEHRQGSPVLDGERLRSFVAAAAESEAEPTEPPGDDAAPAPGAA